MQRDLGELVKVLASLTGAAWRADRARLCTAEKSTQSKAIGRKGEPRAKEVLGFLQKKHNEDGGEGSSGVGKPLERCRQTEPRSRAESWRRKT